MGVLHVISITCTIILLSYNVSRVQFLCFYLCMLYSSLSLHADPLIQLLVDSSRQILYTQSKNNTITVNSLCCSVNYMYSMYVSCHWPYRFTIWDVGAIASVVLLVCRCLIWVTWHYQHSELTKGTWWTLLWSFLWFPHLSHPHFISWQSLKLVSGYIYAYIEDILAKWDKNRGN